MIDAYIRKEESRNRVARSLEQVTTLDMQHSSLVTGVAYLDGRIYAVTKYSGSILVFDGSTFNLLDTITVDGLNIATDLTVDPDRKLIYVSDASLSLWKVDPAKPPTTADQFSTGGFTPLSVSFCRQSSQLVVVMQGVRKLFVYDTDSSGGVQLAPTYVVLPASPALKLNYAMRTSAGTYLVAHVGLSSADRQHDQVTEFSADGTTVVRSYGGHRGSGSGELNKPLYLAIDESDGSVLVADSFNGRVVRLSSSLEFVDVAVEGVPVGCLAVSTTQRQLIVGKKIDIDVYQM